MSKTGNNSQTLGNDGQPVHREDITYVIGREFPALDMPALARETAAQAAAKIPQPGQIFREGF